MYEAKMKAEEIRKEIKKEWIHLWHNRYEDKIVAEGISVNNYYKLKIDKGEVIYSSRNNKTLNFNEILEINLGKNYSELINPHPSAGGWRKFAKTYFKSKQKRKRDTPKIKFDADQQQRKGGRGWINQIRIVKKMRENQD